MGNRLDYLARAREHVEGSVGRVVQCSGIYESEPWGFNHEWAFLNQAIRVETGLDGESLLSGLISIEMALGRVRGEAGYAPRTMDIDIMFIDGMILSTPVLEVPHPKLHLRRFALEPLCEIAPNLIHPRLNQCLSKLLETCPDKLRVWRFNGV